MAGLLDRIIRGAQDNNPNYSLLFNGTDLRMPEFGPARIQPPTTTPYNVDLPGMVSSMIPGDAQMYKDMGNNALDMAMPRDAQGNRNPFDAVWTPARVAGTAIDGLGDIWEAAGKGPTVGEVAEGARGMVADGLEATNAPVNDTIADLGGFLDNMINSGAEDMSEVSDPQAADPKKDTVPPENYQQIESTDTPSQAKNKDVINQGSAGIVEAGGGEKELGAWEKFGQEYDIATVGMALLASNDGSSNLGSNLGKALMMGKQKKESDAAAALESEKDLTKAALEERKVRVSERNSDLAAYVASQNASSLGKAPKAATAGELAATKTFLDSKVTVPGANPDYSDVTALQFADIVKAAANKPGAEGMALNDIREMVYKGMQHDKSSLLSFITGGEIKF